MFKRVYGLETEYALAADGPLAKPMSTIQSKAELYELLESELLSQGPYAICDPTQRTPQRRGEPLIQIREGYFLANGARLYFDAGHLEWAAPETSDPYQALVYDRAGERALTSAALAVEKKMTGVRPLIVKNNIDYQSGVTYGCHENYSVRRRSHNGRNVIKQVVERLIPFFVTRQILCGAGRLGAEEAPYVAFQLSQRADFITDIASVNTRENRPIINLRDEPLADDRRYARLHLILGDSNMAEIPAFLKLGMTGLLLDMIEADADLPNLMLDKPIEALHRVARDLTFRCRLALKGGGAESALGIQRAYLQAAWHYATDLDDGDPLTQQVLQWWDGLLTAIDRQAPELESCLDWAIKRRIMKGILERTNITWEVLKTWEPVLARTWKLSLPQTQSIVNWANWLQSHVSKLEWQAIHAHCHKHKLNLEHYPRFRDIAATFRRLDVGYHDIDARHSQFYRWGRAIRFVKDESALKAAEQHPPDDTRAALRMRAMQWARGHDEKLLMYWDRISLKHQGIDIAMPDPLCNDMSILKPILKGRNEATPEPVPIALGDTPNEDIEVVVLDVWQSADAEDE